MEEKIEIRISCTMTEDDLLDIIETNDPKTVAKAFKDYMNRDTAQWVRTDARASKAEKELAEIKSALATYALKKLNETNE